MKNILAVILLFFVIFLTTKNVNAQYGCVGQYGGCLPAPTIQINKMVGIPDSKITEPSSASFVDSLSPTDPRFSPDQFVFFKVIIKNTSSVSLSNVLFQDFVPVFLNPISGPGSFDSNTRIVSFNAGDFAPNEEKTYFFKMQVLSQNQLPTDRGIFCVTNKVQASNDKVSNTDTSQLCIEKQVAPVTKVPSAGPEFGIALLSIEGLGLMAGLMLKKANK